MTDNEKLKEAVEWLHHYSCTLPAIGYVRDATCTLKLRLVLDELKKLQGWADADKRLEAKVRADERRKVFEEYEDYDASREFAEFLKQSGGEAATEHLRRALRRICKMEYSDD